MVESAQRFGTSKPRRYQATPRYSATDGSICQVWGTITLIQALVARSAANQLCSAPAFSGSVRKSHWPQRLGDSVGRMTNGFFVGSASTEVPATPAARVAVRTRNWRREVKGHYRGLREARRAVYEILWKLFKSDR